VVGIPAETHYFGVVPETRVFKDWMVEILQSIDSVHVQWTSENADIEQLVVMHMIKPRAAV